jgi:hypothetical protein
MLIFTNIARRLPFIYNFEGQRAAIRPPGSGAIRITVNQQRRRALL